MTTRGGRGPPSGGREGEMARSFRYDHFKQPKPAVRPLPREDDRRAFVKTHAPDLEAGGPLKAEGPSTTQKRWKERSEGAPAEARRQRAATQRVKARQHEAPIGALPETEEAPGGDLLRDLEASMHAAQGGVRAGWRQARGELDTLQRALGEAGTALTRLVRVPVDLLRRRRFRPV